MTKHITQVLRMLMCVIAYTIQPAMSEPPQTEEISIALLAGGTGSWEIAAIKELGLDQQNLINIDERSVAQTNAAQIALQAGRVDIILADFLWVANQRAQGANYIFAPHSLSVGGLMVMPQGTITSIEDLRGKTIAVAGGPADKSFIVLKAYYHAKTGRNLTDDISASYGSPPLVNELLLNGKVDAALNFWHFNARADAAGAVKFLAVSDMLSELGVSQTPPLLGWVFSEETANKKSAAITRFLNASDAAKSRLRSNDAIWDRLRANDVLHGINNDDTYRFIRDAYREGIVNSKDKGLIKAVRESFALIVEQNESTLIDTPSELPDGMFWTGQTK